MRTTHLAAVLLAIPILMGASPPPDSAEIGRELFIRSWQPWDERAGHDGLGPMYNATSCVACHGQGGVGGAGGKHVNVIVGGSGKVGDAFTVQHHFSTLSETVPHSRTSVRAERNTPALWGAGLIDAIPSEALEALAESQMLLHEDITGKVARTADGRVAKFGWKGHSASLAEFVATACAVELGLSVAGHEQGAPPTGPLAVAQAAIDSHLERADPSWADDPDLSNGEVDALTAFVRALPAPTRSADPASKGEALFNEIGCATCHVKDVAGVEGLYSDLLLHDIGMGDAASSYGVRASLPQVATTATRLQVVAKPNEWRTPPLWGVRDSAPYFHDGKADTLHAAIGLHRGEAAKSQANYRQLPHLQRLEVVAFLESLTSPEAGS